MASPTDNEAVFHTQSGKRKGCAHPRKSTILISLLVVFGLGAARVFALVQSYAVNVIFVDAWAYDDASLFQQHSLLKIFRWQVGPHRLGLGGILQSLLGPLVHWNSRFEAFLAASLLCLAAASALILKRRLCGSLDYSDVVIPAIFFTPVQYQVLISIVHPSLGPLPVLLCLLYCFAWISDKPRERFIWVTIVNIGVVYTGYGVLIGLITPVLFTVDYFRNRNKWAAAGVLVSLAIIASFFVGYQLNSGVTCFSTAHANPIHYFLFAAFMLSTFIGLQPVFHLAPAVIAGSVLFCLFFCTWIVCAKRALEFRSRVNLAASILLGYTLLFCGTTAYGRMCLGLSAAQSSRYTCYLTLGFFGLYLVSQTVTDRYGRLLFTTVVLGLAILSSVGLRQSDRATMVRLRDGRNRWVSCYLAHHNIQRCDNEAGLAIFWNPEPPDLQTKLDFLEAHHLNMFADAPPRPPNSREGDQR